MSAADYRCRECGITLDFYFEHTPPATHNGVEHVDEHGDACRGTLDRVWTAPHTGRGSSGEPPR
jgi:hypothetical protein